MIIRILTNLQSRADSKGVTAQFAWPAVSKMMQNVTGQDVDYDAFKAQFDATPELKNIVDNFDENGITIKTKAKKQEPGTVGDKQKAKNAVNTSAKRAAAKKLG
jgi:hypothetical protein